MRHRLYTEPLSKVLNDAIGNPDPVHGFAPGVRTREDQMRNNPFPVFVSLPDLG